MKALVVATTNKGKLAELKAMLEPLGFDISSPADHPPLPPIAETEDTFEGNALLKGTAFASHLSTWCLADDSGLEVEALGAKPGVHTARFAGPNASNQENCDKLMAALKGLPPSKRSARFVAAVALCAPDGTYTTVRGVCEGRIAELASGTGGFGYDPIFIPEGFDQTMAELGAAQKNAISHRAKALNLLLPIIQRLMKQ